MIEKLNPQEQAAAAKRFKSKPLVVDAELGDGDLHPHELALAFPSMDQTSFDELTEDIRQRGVIHPVVILDGLILDGLHRWKACRKLGIRCPTTEFTGDDPVGFVVAVNLRRRHLTTAERAVIAAGLATLSKGSNQHRQDCRPSVAEAAKALHVSERSVASAKRVLEKGSDDLIDAIKTGKVSLSEAERLAKKPNAKQLSVEDIDFKLRQKPRKISDPRGLEKLPWMRACAAIDAIADECERKDVEPILLNVVWHSLNRFADDFDPAVAKRALKDIEWEIGSRLRELEKKEKEDAP